MIYPPLLFCTLSFLLGSIPFGFLFARFFSNKDIRKEGSGNVGATNVSRVLGVWPWGVATLILDVLKGALAVIIVLPSVYAYWVEKTPIGEWDWSTTGIWSVGLFAILGHCYSPWLKLKGGKGVATALGIFAVLSPVSAVVGIIVFGWSFYLNRIASLASLSGISAAFLSHFLGRELSPELLPILAIYLVVIVRHESNIESLLNGHERTL